MMEISSDSHNYIYIYIYIYKVMVTAYFCDDEEGLPEKRITKDVHYNYVELFISIFQII